MRWIERLMRRGGTPDAPGARGSAPERWIVLDVETTGLDTRQDKLLAIAAVAVNADARRPVVDLGDSFEVVLRREGDVAAPPDRDNILLHGTGVGAQRSGQPAAQALRAFADYADGAPLIAFHAAFDRAFIEHAFRAARLPVPRNPWLDLEPLAAVLRSDGKARALDDWMAALGIHCAVRHQAAADTLATAELLLMLWPALRTELPHPSFDAVARLAAQRRWVRP